MVSKPFSLNNNSDFSYNVQYGVTDTIKAKTILDDNISIEYNLSLIDANTGKTIGSFEGVTFDKSNVRYLVNQSYQISTKGMGNKQVMLKLAANVKDPANVLSPDYYLTSSYSDEGNAVQKKGIKNISCEGENIIKSYALEQNYPNPFNPTTKINYQIPNSDYITIKVYDVLGNVVKTLVEEYREKGKHSINFDASRLASGIYFYQLKAGNFISTKKLLLLK